MITILKVYGKYAIARHHFNNDVKSNPGMKAVHAHLILRGESLEVRYASITPPENLWGMQLDFVDIHESVYREDLSEIAVDTLKHLESRQSTTGGKMSEQCTCIKDPEITCIVRPLEVRELIAELESEVSILSEQLERARCVNKGLEEAYEKAMRQLGDMGL